MSDDLDLCQPPEVRAERLRLLVEWIGEEPELRAGEALRYAPAGWGEHIGEATPADVPEFALAWGLAEVAMNVRERQWRALERLVALLPGGTGTIADRINAAIPSLPVPDVRRLVGAALLLGWGEDD